MIASAAILLSAGLVAEGLRARTAAIYAALETPAMRLSPDTGSVPDRMPGPAGAAGWDLLRDGGSRPCGTEVLVLAWKREDGSVLRKDWITPRVVRRELVPVARRRLERGRALDSSSVRWEWRETGGKSQAPPDSATAGRWRVRTGAEPGQILTKAILEPEALVRAGDRLLVRSSRAGAAASVEGIAQSDAAPGAPVLVLTPWGRRIRCRLEPDGSATSLQ